MEPRAPAARELVDDVLPAIENRRAQQNVLLNAQRTGTSMNRRHDAQPAEPGRRAEAFLLMTGRPAAVAVPRGPQPQMERLDPVAPRRIDFRVAKALGSVAAMKLARADHAGAPHRILVRQRPFRHVG